MSSVSLPSPQLRQTCLRTALKPVDDKACSILSFNAECHGQGPDQRQHWKGYGPQLSTVALLVGWLECHGQGPDQR